MPRFVVLRHEMPPDSGSPVHWDFMLEDGESLLTWAIDELPRTDRAIAARRLADHRLAYLTYEGPVSNNRGRVTQADAGSFDWLERCENRWRVRLDGVGLRGVVTLAAEACEGDPAAQFWALSFSHS
jgi:hypothetical protein